MSVAVVIAMIAALSSDIPVGHQRMVTWLPRPNVFSIMATTGALGRREFFTGAKACPVGPACGVGVGPFHGWEAAGSGGVTKAGAFSRATVCHLRATRWAFKAFWNSL